MHPELTIGQDGPSTVGAGGDAHERAPDGEALSVEGLAQQLQALPLVMVQQRHQAGPGVLGPAHHMDCGPIRKRDGAIQATNAGRPGAHRATARRRLLVTRWWKQQDPASFDEASQGLDK